MPRATIESGAADAVLPAARLPEAVLAYARRAPDAEAADRAEDDARAPLGEIVRLMRTRLKRDFSDYKPTSLLRRARRRMGLHALDELDDYVALLERDRDELEALGRDRLINVTAFFRDEEAWRALDRAVIRPLVAEAETGAALRA